MDNLVAIVDDDEAVRASTALFLNSGGIRTQAFSNGDAFLAADAQLFTCILLDLRMAGTDGLAVLQSLSERAFSPPVLVISGHGDVAAAVQAIRLGARDFLEKPYAPEDLLSAVEAACIGGRQGRDALKMRDEAATLVTSLTTRQRDVAQGILRGDPNKIIAFKLGLSVRTVEAYRATIFKKLGVRNASDLVRLLGQVDWAEG